MTDSRLATLATEVVTQATPSRRLATRAVETLVAPSGITRRAATVAIEVLIPNVVVDNGYSGWGIRL
jgi:hypothetical protein